MSVSWKRADADWLREAKWGTMTHFLADAASCVEETVLPMAEWNGRVDGVDVKRLAEQIAGTGAGYQIFTLGQNSGYFCSPNATYDSLVGQPSRLSDRDLLADLATALKTRGVRTIAYLPSSPPCNQREAVERLKFTPTWDMSRNGYKPGEYTVAEGIDDRLTEGLRNWEAIIREWSLRWGDLVSGWWFDGCYYADKLYEHDGAPNFQSFAEAAKAGNTKSIVAFNSGVKIPVPTITPYEDYTAGELNDLWIGNKWHPMTDKVGGAQLQILTYLGNWWGQGPTRFTDELAVSYTKHVIACGGALTWDIPISYDGQIPEEFRRQLSVIGTAVR